MTKLKPCPFCGSTNVQEEYTAVAEGHEESQLGWVECNDCDASGPTVRAIGLHIYQEMFGERVRAAWNNAPRGDKR